MLWGQNLQADTEYLLKFVTNENHPVLTWKKYLEVLSEVCLCLDNHRI